jgi:hypothetical protein
MRELCARLSLLGFCLCFCRRLSHSFAFVCLSLATLFVFWFPPFSDWYRTNGFLFLWAWSSFGRHLYIRVVYVRSYSSPRSNSLHSTIIRYSLRHSSLLFTLDTLTKYLSLLLDTSLVSISTRSLQLGPGIRPSSV